MSNTPNIKCLFVAPEVQRISALHRRLSVKSIVDMITSDGKLNEAYIQYASELNPEGVHHMLSNATYKKNKVSFDETVEIDIDNIVNVPIKMLASPLQIANSIEYYAQRTDPYAMMMEPVMLPFDINEDPADFGWTSQEHSSDI